MSNTKSKQKLQLWFSLISTLVLLGAIFVTQFAANTSRDQRTNAATCGAGQLKLTLRPNQDISAGRWANGFAGGYYAQVDETASDENASYIWDDTALAGGSVVVFGHPSSGLSTSAYVVKSVTIGARVRQNQSSQTGPYIETGMQIGGGQFFSPGTKFHPPATNAYASTEYTWTTNPATGAGWSVSSVNSAYIAARSTRPSQPNSINLTQMWMDVCYSSAPPAITLTADNPNLAYNSATTIRWSATNATSCSVSWSGGSWGGLSGAQSTGNLTSIRTYTANCSGAGGSASKQVTVYVGAAPPAPTPKPSPTPKPTPKPTSGPGSTPAPSPAVKVDHIVLTSGRNTFLVGGKEVSVTVEGSSINKKLVFTKKAESFNIDTNSLTLGQTYNLKITGQWLIPQVFNFKLADGVSLQAAVLKLGDLNSDGTIDDKDVVEFLDGFLNDKFYDLNSDGVVNSFDYSILIGNIG